MLAEWSRRRGEGHRYQPASQSLTKSIYVTVSLPYSCSGESSMAMCECSASAVCTGNELPRSVMSAGAAKVV